MPWAGLISGLIRLAAVLLEYTRERRLIDYGKMLQVNQARTELDKRMASAAAAVRRMHVDPAERRRLRNKYGVADDGVLSIGPDAPTTPSDRPPPDYPVAG